MKIVALLALLCGSIVAVAQPDNRYCGAGDVAQFGAEKDGPAELPTHCINTALDSTPSPGKSIKASNPKELQSAIEAASCGDTIVLQAGATYSPFELPAKKCDARHWITLRTSTSDKELPPEGTRVTPCYGSVSSLPGRPRYPCSEPKPLLARVEIKVGAGAITFLPGANHYRLIGLEVTRTTGSGTVYGLIRLQDNVDHVVIDRCWIHGTAADETVRGVYLGGSSYTGIVDSFFSDFHCIARTGACTDGQAINGGNSKVAVGVYKVVNNYLEAAGENFMLGGGGGATVPADIEIRRNYLFKPLTWLRGQPDFVGTTFIVKNLFELKNAERLLFEGNILENSWGGFTQVGFAILLTPRGEWAAVQDITIRYDLVIGSGAGMQLAATRADQGGDSRAAQRWSIHDVLLRDLDPQMYNGSGVVFQLTSGFRTNPPLNNVTVDHVTVAAKGQVKSLLLVGAAPANPQPPFNIKFTNNIAPAGKFSVWSTGSGTCAKSGQPMTTFESCWKNFEVKNNAILDYPSDQGSWPAGNFYAKNMHDVGLVESEDDSGYRLATASKYRKRGGDGKDLGADIDAILTATRGVR